MTFSIRMALAAISFLALLLAAVLSHSLLFIAIITLLVLGINLLSLPFAIVSTGRRREFWIGFFVLSCGTLVLSNYNTSFDRIATNVMHPTQKLFSIPDVQVFIPSTNLRPGPASTVYNGTVPQLPPGMFLPNPVPPLTYPTNSQELAALKELVNSLLALIFGIVGGLATIIGNKPSFPICGDRVANK